MATHRRGRRSRLARAAQALGLLAPDDRPRTGSRAWWVQTLGLVALTIALITVARLTGLID